MRDEAPVTLERLASERDAEVVAAVRALSLRGLGRDPLAVEMARLLHDHPSATVRGQVCRGLQRLGSAAVLRDLVHALDDEDSSVRAHAHAALLTLTGRSLPPDQEAWMDELVGTR
jgi:HEAT repeat protein